MPDAEIPRRYIKLASCDVGEEEVDAIREVLYSGVLTNGPRTKSFEERFAERHGVAEAVALANGTLALAGMYLALGIGAGDEVIVPSLTFVSSATSVLHVGATPVFADVDAETFTLDPVDVAGKLTFRTKAILAVHYGGQPADMDELRALAHEAGVVLLEDAAEAHGASYKGQPVGGLATAAMFSFTPTKNMTTGEGAMVTTNDAALADRLRLLRNHGQIDLYRHETLGFNWRMTEMQAAMGEVQLAKLDAILSRKRANARKMAALLAGLAGITLPVGRPDRDHVFMLYTVLVQRDRDAVMARLLNAGVEARWYFPPAHRQPMFSCFPASVPVTDHLASKMLSVPFHSRLTEDDLRYVASALGECIAR